MRSIRGLNNKRPLNKKAAANNFATAIIYLLNQISNYQPPRMDNDNHLVQPKFL